MLKQGNKLRAFHPFEKKVQIIHGIFIPKSITVHNKFKRVNGARDEHPGHAMICHVGSA